MGFKSYSIEQYKEAKICPPLLYTVGYLLTKQAEGYNEALSRCSSMLNLLVLKSPSRSSGAKETAEQFLSIMCATHGAQLGGESPLWGLAVANH